VDAADDVLAEGAVQEGVDLVVGGLNLLPGGTTPKINVAALLRSYASQLVGERVTPDSAMRTAAVWACVRVRWRAGERRAERCPRLRARAGPGP
jgi:hypothetical protein